MSIEIDIQPRPEVLQVLGVTRAEFDAALDQTLGALDENGELPIPEDMSIILGGRKHRLGAIASIEVTTSGDIQIADDDDVA